MARAGIVVEDQMGGCEGAEGVERAGRARDVLRAQAEAERRNGTAIANWQ